MPQREAHPPLGALGTITGTGYLGLVFPISFIHSDTDGELTVLGPQLGGVGGGPFPMKLTHPTGVPGARV